MRVLLVGPMTGIPDFNKPAFNHATKELENIGFEVLNPATMFKGDTSKPWHKYMERTLHEILSGNAQGVVTLLDFEHSKGAQMEVAIAELMELPVQSFEDVMKMAGVA